MILGPEVWFLEEKKYFGNDWSKKHKFWPKHAKYQKFRKFEKVLDLDDSATKMIPWTSKIDQTY